MLHVSLGWSHPSSVYLFNFALWGAVRWLVFWPRFTLWTQIKTKCCSPSLAVVISSLLEDPSICPFSSTNPTLFSSDWGIPRRSPAGLEIQSLHLVLGLPGIPREVHPCHLSWLLSRSSRSTLSLSWMTELLTLFVKETLATHLTTPISDVCITTSFFQSWPIARDHRWGSEQRPTGRLRALLFGSAFFLWTLCGTSFKNTSLQSAPRNWAYRRMDRQAGAVTLGNTWTQWQLACERGGSGSQETWAGGVRGQNKQDWDRRTTRLRGWKDNIKCNSLLDIRKPQGGGGEDLDTDQDLPPVGGRCIQSGHDSAS